MILDKPFVSCICPTYKRPKHLANMIACFERQTYPMELCELIVLDDAGQYHDQVKQNWRIISRKKRYANLPKKYNWLAERAQGEVLSVWEDDDIYLPEHVEKIARAYVTDYQFFHAGSVYSTYEERSGFTHTEPASGRFHASWAYTHTLFDEVNGYQDDDRLIFDQDLRSRMLDAGATASVYTESPTYVYRWGNGIYHGSQAGDDGYAQFYNGLAALKSGFVGLVKPKLDQETSDIFQNLAVFA